MPIDTVGEQITRNISAAKWLRKRAAQIDYPAAGHVPAAKPAIGDVFEVPERVWIMERAVFGEAFHIISALDLVQRDLFAPVRPGNDIAVLVEIEAPSVAPALGEQLEPARDRVVPPDPLLKFDAAD